MKFKILTLFPEMFPGPLAYSLSGKALSKKLFEIEVINIRDFSNNKSNSVDAKPYGGGAGMIIKPDVMQNALNYATKDNIQKKKFYFYLLEVRQ